MSAIDAGEATPTEGIADQSDVMRIAARLAREIWFDVRYDAGDVIQLARFLQDWE